MKNIIKDLLKSVVISIGMALVIFSLVCVVFDICNKGSFSLENYRLTKMVAASVIVGLGFGVPTVVYNSERLPMPVKVAFAVGWFGGSATLAQGLIIAGIQLAVAFVIWFCFMRYYRKEAKRMNEKIQSKKQ